MYLIISAIELLGYCLIYKFVIKHINSAYSVNLTDVLGFSFIKSVSYIVIIQKSRGSCKSLVTLIQLSHKGGDNRFFIFTFYLRRQMRPDMALNDVKSKVKSTICGRKCNRRPISFIHDCFNFINI